MSENRYRGESPGKKQARILFWSLVEDRLGKEAFRHGPYLVISSKEAGDVSTLISMGVDPPQIHAVDIDPHAIAAANKKFGGKGGAKFYVTDFAEANDFCGIRTFACAFIDMCAPIRRSHLHAIVSLGAKLKGYEFLLGREKDLVSKYIQSVTRSNQHTIEPRLQYLNSQGFETGTALYYSSGTETTIGMSMCVAVSSAIKPKGKTIEIIEVKFGYRELRRKIVRANGSQMPLLYNVPAGTAAAWRAWETRRK